MKYTSEVRTRKRSTKRSLTTELDVKQIKILLIEDDEADYLHIDALLKECRVGSYHITWARSFDGGLEFLENVDHDFHVCLLDYRLGGRSGVDLLRDHGSKFKTPVIMLSGAGSYEVDAEAMRLGAADYFDKQEATSSILERSMRYAIRNYRLETELKALAHQDALTGLDNPRMFKSKLRDALARARRGRFRVALLFLDLDRFKVINDTYGHSIGDGLLAEVGRRLRDVVRESDLVSRASTNESGQELGRLGGDEFVILLEGVAQDYDVRTVAIKIMSHVAEQPFHISGHQISIGLSIGFACYPDHGNRACQLIEMADRAMYAAKAKQGNTVECYTAIAMK